MFSLYQIPDNSRARLLALSASPTLLIKLSTSSLTLFEGVPFKLAKNHRCSSTVRCSKSTLNWGHTPRSCRIWIMLQRYKRGYLTQGEGGSVRLLEFVHNCWEKACNNSSLNACYLIAVKLLLINYQVWLQSADTII